MSSSMLSDAPPPPVSDLSDRNATDNTGDELTMQNKPTEPTNDKSEDTSKNIDAPDARPHTAVHGPDDGPDSEAETLIDSPVKRREAEKNANKSDRPSKSRIGSLPVPGEDDDESDARESPIESVEPNGTLKEKRVNGADILENASSDALSSPRSTGSNSPSRQSSHSRAFSESRELGRDSADSPNPRKRKHRASSVSLPNKRASKEDSIRATGARVSDQAVISGADRSTSPKLRSHRRAISTQSAVADGQADIVARKRSKAPAREPKGRNGWEESDASSETTSLGNIEPKRPQRGVGRSTSTPGRPVGREHKRHLNKYGFTRLAEACEAGDLDAVKEWRDKDPDQLELAEFAQNKPLQIAALNGNDEVVAYLIDQGCQIDCANVDKDTPLIDAAENGHLEVVKILLNAGVDPLRQNLKGQQALDVVTDDIDDADLIRAELRRAIESWNSDDVKQRREEEEVQRHQAGTNKGLHFMARSYENLLKLVTVNDRSGVREFLDARVPVDNAIVAAAAKTGDLYLVNMLLAEMTEKKAYQKAEKPMLAVIGTSHFDMVKALTELDQFNPLYKTRAGKTWPELADDKNGPNAKQEKELLQALYDKAISTSARRSSSPVVKRENGKRRHAHLGADEDEDEDSEDTQDATTARRRKNGRRLMSRRDMRAASGKNASESDIDSSSSDAESSPEEPAESSAVHESMKPPNSAARRRGNPPRRKSSSTQPPEDTPRTRRRSLSLRDTKAGAPVPGEKEESMADNVTVHVDRDEKAEHPAEPPNGATSDSNTESKIEGERALGEAMEIVQDDRDAQETKDAQEARDAQIADAEAEAEALRKAEQEKLEKEREEKEAQEEVQRQLRAQVLEQLPAELRHVFQSDSDFQWQGETARHYLLSHFTPMLVTKESDSANGVDSGEAYKDTWVLNAQAAPLLGKRGLELLLPMSAGANSRTFSEPWSRIASSSTWDQRITASVLDALLSESPADLDAEAMDLDGDEDVAFEQELRELADIYNTKLAAKQRLAKGEVEVYAVRLADVLEHLDPVLQDAPIQMRSLDWPRRCAETAKLLDIRGMESVMARFASGFWDGERTPYRVVNNGPQPSTNGTAAAHLRTKVTLISEKQ